MGIVRPNLLNLATANALVRLHLDNTFHIYSNGDVNDRIVCSCFGKESRHLNRGWMPALYYLANVITVMTSAKVNKFLTLATAK